MDLTFIFWLICMAILAAVFLAAVFLAAFGSGKTAEPVEKEPSDTFGTASYARQVTDIPHPYYPLGGVFFGKSSQPGNIKIHYLDDDPGAPVCSTPENHTLIVARTRTGKGTRVIVPTLLRYAGSVLVIDPKGESAAA